METPKDQLIEMYYRRIQAMEFKINQLQTQLNKNNERKNNTH
tara:strand:+ start:371 stop:496 length:126 start_codon:yes stop_codon:yes gene_type:complete